MQKSWSILDEQFPSADKDAGLRVYYVWGVGQVDRTGVNRLLDPEFFGEARFVSDFSFNEKCQADLLELCEKLRTDFAYKDLIKREDGLGLTYCFLEELGAYNVKKNLDDCDFVASGEWKNENWQVASDALKDIIPGFLDQKTCFGESREETIATRYQNEIGWDGVNMMFASISVESGVLDPVFIKGEAATRKEYNQFLEIADKQTKVSEICGGSVIMTDLDLKFTFMNNQSIYKRSAIQSSILGVAIAFCVLLVSTRVFHREFLHHGPFFSVARVFTHGLLFLSVAFFASLSITCVLLSVIGVMVMLGWDLGTVEGILIAIIAGFSVDYVVHLAHAYETALGDTYARVTTAFGDLGISVFNGMVTSVVASIPLFFCQLKFFSKFGAFLCITVAFSWIFANFGFMSILAQLKIPLKGRGCRL